MGDDRKKDEIIDFTEKGTVEYSELPYESKMKKNAFYIILVAFVFSLLACLFYGMYTSNENMIMEVLTLFKAVILIMVGYYFGTKK